MHAAAAADSGQRLGEEERHDTIADVATHQPTGVDHALVRHPNQTATEIEVGRCRQPSRQLRGAFEVGEQDRGGSPGRLGGDLHSLEVAQISHRGHRPDHRHGKGRLCDHTRPDESSGRVSESRGEVRDLYRSTDTWHSPLERGHDLIIRNEIINHVVEHRIKKCSQLFASAWKVGEHQRPDLCDLCPDLLDGEGPKEPRPRITHVRRAAEHVPDPPLCEFIAAAQHATHVISHIHQPPLIVIQKAPVPGVAHGRSGVREFRIVRQGVGLRASRWHRRTVLAEDVDRTVHTAR